MRLSVAVICVASGLMVSAQQPARDVNAMPAAAATGVIAGTLITDGTPGTPVRRALVTLANPAAAVGRIGGGPSASPTSVVTDDAGRFAFTGLPAGRFTISAAKPALLERLLRRDASRPGRNPDSAR